MKDRWFESGTHVLGVGAIGNEPPPQGDHLINNLFLTMNIVDRLRGFRNRAAGARRPIAAGLFVPMLACFLACVPQPEPDTSAMPRPAELRRVYQVAGVSDGDTLAVQDGPERRVVRLAGIDAPESGQDFGQVSKRHLAEMVNGRSVELIGDKTDPYGRTVAKVLADGRDVNLEQVKAGLAWHYKQYEKEQTLEDRRIYASAEAEARAAKQGLWSHGQPVPPWDWRTGRNVASTEGVPEGAVIGNRNSRIYHTPGCSTYGKVSPKNRVVFADAAEAEAAGYRHAGSFK